VSKVISETRTDGCALSEALNLRIQQETVSIFTAIALRRNGRKAPKDNLAMIKAQLDLEALVYEAQVDN